MRVEKVIQARPWTALGVLATAQFLVVLATSIVNVALPELRTGLGLSASGLSWVVNAYVLVFGALLLLGGRLGDVYGRRRVFLAGTAIFTLSLVAAGAAGNAAVLIAARAAQGVGAALLAPAALALVLTLFPAGEGRGTALGVWGAVSGAGGAAGVLLGGVLSGAFGWRSVFFAVVPIAVAVLLTTAKYIEADVPRGGRLDPVGAVTVTAGLVAVTYGLSATSVLPLIAGLILLVVFVLTQRGTAAPLVPSGIFSIGSVAAANVLMALVGAVWIGLFFFLPLYQQRVLGYSPVLAGVTQLPMALTITAASWTAPKLARRFTGRTVLTGGLAVQAIGLAWLSLTPADASFAADLLGSHAAGRRGTRRRVRPAHHGLGGGNPGRGQRPRRRTDQHHPAGRRRARPGPAHRRVVRDGLRHGLPHGGCHLLRCRRARPVHDPILKGPLTWNSPSPTSTATTSPSPTRSPRTS